ncbi:MAG: DUF2690 domain-containing protein [Kineosporiaceae bacterium]
MHAVRRLVTTLAATALIGAGGLAVAAPASAATCVGAGCSGRSPVGTTCANDARTLDSFTVVSGEGATYGWVSWKVELRNSPSCAASWTRATGKVNKVIDGGPIGITVGLGAWSRLDPSVPVHTDPTHYHAEKYVKAVKGATFQFSTRMVSDTSIEEVRSCSTAYAGSPCTPWQHM